MVQIQSGLCGFWVCFLCLCGGHRLTGDSKLTVCVCLSVSVYEPVTEGNFALSFPFTLDDERLAKNQRIPELMTKVFVSLELKLYSIQ